jgi:SAM-dependent methyltransferase
VEDSKRRFTLAADAYARYRPSYPPDLVRFVLGDVPRGGRIADVGCGTGITTRLFSREGHRVVGVDPNEAMLARARSEGGLFLRGDATATGLLSCSVDLVIAGQAFHWFAHEGALGEFARILKPGRPAAVFWNERGRSAFMDAYEELLVGASHEYRAIPKPGPALAFLRSSERVEDLREHVFPNNQAMDRDGFFGRVHSSSYVVHGIPDLEAFDRGLQALFDHHARDGRVAFAYETLAARFRLSGGPGGSASRMGSPPPA